MKYDMLTNRAEMALVALLGGAVLLGIATAAVAIVALLKAMPFL